MLRNANSSQTLRHMRAVYAKAAANDHLPLSVHSRIITRVRLIKELKSVEGGVKYLRLTAVPTLKSGLPSV